MTRSRFAAALGALLLILSACGSEKPSDQPSANTAVTGAKSALLQITKLTTAVADPDKPAVLLSIYVAIALSDGLAVPVHAALDGIASQVALHGPPTEENVHDYYTLLEEFGTVLHVDVNDLLNRSSDRIETLDTYALGLGNITERSRRRADDLKQQITGLRDQERQQKKTVSLLDKEVKNALKAKDYATAGSQQQALLEAQQEATATSLQLKELAMIQKTLQELLDIAGDRIKALESNREILIAGLKVVDVPGVDDLGVLEGAGGKTRKKKGGFSPFGGL